MPLEDRQHATSGGSWEAMLGYSRAIRVGNVVHVSGTTADGATAGEQASKIFDIIEKALKDLDSSLEHVVRTRMYVTDIDNDWEAIGKVHAERVGAAKPACTMLQIAKFIAPEVKVEIEVEAIVPQSSL
mmetsp:Transcript_7261/g.12023  ORF Transcript_7261/g.12023 Transcript_7261/m.12023 type:complete len:129 (+) Transcript_7261:90-476(+)